MQSTDQPSFFEALIATAEIYGKNLSPEAQMLYWHCLSAFEAQAVIAALRRCCMDPDTGQFMPKPADVIRQIKGGTEDQALLAWTNVEKAITRIGCYASVVFDDPIIHAVLQDMGGWVQLCKVTDDELPFKRNEFVTRYRDYAQRQAIPPHPQVLTGLVNAERRMLGYEPEEPRFVGNKEKCKAVMTGATQPEALGNLANWDGFVRIDTQSEPKQLVAAGG